MAGTDQPDGYFGAFEIFQLWFYHRRLSDDHIDFSEAQALRKLFMRT